MIKVVAALIFKDKKVLIAKRKDKGNSALKWEFPGGKVEANENEYQAIEREIKEEFNVIVKAKKFICNSIYEYPDKTIDLRLYECEYFSGDFSLIDHLDYKWVNIDDLSLYDLASADISLANYIKNIYK